MANILNIENAYEHLYCYKDEISEHQLSNLYKAYPLEQDGTEFNSEKLSFIDIVALAYLVKWQHEFMIKIMKEECKNNITEEEYCDEVSDPDLHLHLHLEGDHNFSWHLHTGCGQYLTHTGFAGSTGYSPLKPRQRRPYPDRVKGIIPNIRYLEIANELLENALEDQIRHGKRTKTS